MKEIFRILSVIFVQTNIAIYEQPIVAKLDIIINMYINIYAAR